MIERKVSTEKGTFTILIHSANSVSIRAENETPVIANKIPYVANTHYTVEDMIFTETYRFVSRSDIYGKEVTFDQKNRVCDVLKSEAFNYIFSYPELLQEAQEIWVKGKMRSMILERDELVRKADAKLKEMADFAAEHKFKGF